MALALNDMQIDDNIARCEYALKDDPMFALMSLPALDLLSLLKEVRENRIDDKIMRRMHPADRAKSLLAQCRYTGPRGEAIMLHVGPMPKPDY